MNDNLNSCGCGCNNGGLFSSFCSGNNEILFFLIVFLLLFTNFGCCCSR